MNFDWFAMIDDESFLMNHSRTRRVDELKIYSDEELVSEAMRIAFEV